MCRRHWYRQFTLQVFIKPATMLLMNNTLYLPSAAIYTAESLADVTVYL